MHKSCNRHLCAQCFKLVSTFACTKVATDTCVRNVSNLFQLLRAQKSQQTLLCAMFQTCFDFCVHKSLNRHFCAQCFKLVSTFACTKVSTDTCACTKVATDTFVRNVSNLFQ